MNFSKQLKKYREQNNFSQEVLAEKIYVTRQTISKWENDKSYPDIHNLIALSVLFDITLDQLVKGDVEMLKSIRDIYQYKEWNFIFNVLILLSLFFMIVGRKLLGEVFSLCMGGLIVLIIFIKRMMLYHIEKKNKIETTFINFKSANEILFMLENPDLELRDIKIKHNKSKTVHYVSTVGLFIVYIIICAYISKLI